MNWFPPVFFFAMSALACYWATGDRVVYYKGGYTPMPRRKGKIVMSFVGTWACALGLISLWLLLRGR